MITIVSGEEGVEHSSKSLLMAILALLVWEGFFCSFFSLVPDLLGMGLKN